MNITSTNEMHHILVAHVINSLACTSHVKHDVVECELTKFLAMLNRLLKDYQNYFEVQEKLDMIGSDLLRSIIQGSDLKEIINVHEDLVKIDVSPQKFQTTLSTILVDTAIRYSDVLKEEVNKLTKDYHNAEDVIPTEEPENVNVGAEEATQTLAPTSETDAIKMEVDEPQEPQEENISAITNDTDAQVALIAQTEKDEDVVESKPEANNEEEKIDKTPDLNEGKMDIDGEDVEEDENQDETRNATEVQIAVENAPLEKEDEEPQQAEGASPDAAESKEATPEEAPEMETSPISNPDTLDVRDSRISEPESALTPMSQPEELPEVSTPLAGNTVEEPKEEHETAEAGPVQEKAEELTRKRSHSPVIDSQKHKRFQNIAINLIKTIEEHRFLSPFLVPVNAKEYEDVIFEPKDLKSILKAVRQKDFQMYGTVKELERDIMLMFANCVMYNKSNTPLVEMAKQMKDDVKKTFKMFEDAELDIK